jgi:small subunit ribosomal protein S16
VVRIRMQRLGRRHRPFFRINAIDQRTRRNGRVIENLGWYDPLEKDAEKQVHLKEERIRHWLSVGAQPSETMKDMLASADLLPPKMKAEWESDREKARNRVVAKTSVSKAEGAVTKLGEMAGDAVADLNDYIAKANEALKAAQAAVSEGNIDAAAKAADEATAQIDAAKVADDKAKAEKAAAEAKAAEEEAAAKAAEEAEGGDAPAEEAKTEA